MPFSWGVTVRRASDPFPADSGEARQDISSFCASRALTISQQGTPRAAGPHTAPLGLHCSLAWAPSTTLGPGLGVLGSPCPGGPWQVGTEHQNILMAQPRYVNYCYLFLFTLSLSLFLILTLNSLFLLLISPEYNGRNMTTI